MDEKLRQTVHAVMGAGLAYGAPEALYCVQNYHKRALNAIHNDIPGVDCDVILVRPKVSQHVFCQQNHDYKWNEVNSQSKHKKQLLIYFFSPPELKAQVSFSDSLLSVCL